MNALEENSNAIALKGGATRVQTQWRRKGSKMGGNSGSLSF